MHLVDSIDPDDDTPVLPILVCGAGAAGLTLAIDLARRRIDFRLIDKLERPFPGSRGKGLAPRTLEVFEALGLVDRVAAAGGAYPPQHEYRSDGGHDVVQGVDGDAPTPDEPYRTPLLVAQWRTEAVMRERLTELGHAVEYGVELLELEQDADGVTVRIAGPDGEERVRCRYLVGGDGGHSRTRHLLGIDFPGKTLGVRAVVADLVLDGLSRDAWHRFNEGDMATQVGLCPLPGTELFQLQAPVPAQGEIDLSSAGLQAFVETRVPGRDLTVGEVSWASVYAMNARLAARYRSGRVFLMGDAAHIHPPTGGQGLNTSVQDAWNLGWKLAAVLGGAPDALLDTYEAERRPVAAGMLGLATDKLDEMRRGNLRRGRDLHQLDLAYPGSSLSLEVPERNGGVLAGDRAPDAALVGAAGQPRRLFDLLRGPHWTLVVRGAAGATGAALPAPRPGLRIVRIGPDAEYHDPDDALGRDYGLAADDGLLVRPDGYMGALVAARDAARLAGYLEGVLPPAPRRA